MSPIKIFGFLFIILASLLCIAAIFPSSGIPLTENLSLNFPTPSEIFYPKERKRNLNAERIIKIDNNDSTETITEKIVERIDFVIDSTDATRLHYPHNNKAILYPLFELLDSIKNYGGSTRILHYGDSQIEEDRMTGIIRARLQKEFGGSGPGLMCPVPVAVPMSMYHSWSGNFERYVVFGNYWDRAEHNRYGVMCAFGKYDGNSASLIFKESRFSQEVSKRVERCKIIYGYGESNLEVELIADGQTVGSKTLYAGKKLHFTDLELDSSAKELKFRFNGESPEIYAIALDTKEGLSVDNIPIRGSSGIDFTKLDSSHFAEMLTQLHVSAVILQFGGNVVPSIKGQKDLDWYRKNISSQLSLFKNMGIAIIMIGMADMSTSRKGQMVTQPYLTAVRDIIKEEVLKVDGVFWDMFESMGGENSMPEFVKSNPPLAIDDYIHFNREGAAKMSRLFTKSLMKDYNEYKMRMELKSIVSHGSSK